MATLRLPVYALVLLLPLAADGALKDPTNRDEDISATTVTATVDRTAAGFYEYIYRVEFPPENRGTVLTFELDIACELDFEPAAFPEEPDPSARNASDDGAHVPVQMYSAPGVINTAVSAHNRALWGVGGRPGDELLELRLISPAPPAQRHYELWPAMDTTGWDYPELEEHPEIPWIDDFKVTGLVQGPACDTSAPQPLYPGNRRGFESEAANQLLTWREPTRDRWHAGPQEQSVTFTIVYSEIIDSGSFRVTPGWARRHFSPEPGTEETVELPLKPGINRLKFEARVAKSAEPRGGEQLHHSEKDMDEFEIRVPSPGRGKAKR